MNFKIFDLGLIDYEDSINFQKEIFLKVRLNLLESALIINSHNPIITLGRLADKNNILAGEGLLKKSNIRVLRSDRGGDVTYHGPGQLTLYPILDLTHLRKDVHLFLRFLEGLVINCLEALSIPARRKQGKSGVWVEGKKISSVGISVKNWITFHGISLNVAERDMENFKLIRPCGLDTEMTCVESVLNRPVPLEEVKSILLKQFTRTLNNFYGGAYDQSNIAGISRRS